MPDYVAVYSSPDEMPTASTVDATSRAHAKVKAESIANNAGKETTVKVFGTKDAPE